jgi:sec-independent protein translocase protein TatA
MPNVGPMELIVILAIALIVLGPKKLPEVGKSLGKGMREFKDSLSGDSDDDRDRDRPPARVRDRDRDEDERPALRSE